MYVKDLAIRIKNCFCSLSNEYIVCEVAHVLRKNYKLKFLGVSVN